MDRRRPAGQRSACQRGIRQSIMLAATLILIAAGPSTAPLLREQAWTAPSANLAYDLTHALGECLAASTPEIEIGRALFRSPALLGGPAARAGLSCHACHSNGRVNARFLLPELSNRVGAADVTSEWSSKLRGDGVMNPVDIPDLAGISRRQSFGRARDPSLESFVRDVIVEEFQGEPPPGQAFAGLLAYLRALDTCAATPSKVTLETAAADVRSSLAAARLAEPATSDLLALAAQDGIGRIVERLPAATFARERRRFETLARELGAWRGNSARVEADAAPPAWMARFDANVARVAAREARSYFNQGTLAAALRTQQVEDSGRPRA